MRDPSIAIDLHVENLCTQYAKDFGISTDESLRILLGTKTYECLLDVDTGLCFEAFGTIYTLILEELNCELQNVN